MLYAFLANATAFLHLSFVVFAVLGGLLALRWRRAACVHVPAAVVAVMAAVTGWICPLTPLENRFRALAEQTGYTENFLDHYLFSILYPAGLTRPMQITMGVAALTFNILVYCLVYILYRRSVRRI